MTDLLKDRYRIGIILFAVFLIGTLISLYQIYLLPFKLMVTEGFHPALSNVFIVLILTFIVGTASLWIVLNNQKEIIVFREKDRVSDSVLSSGNEAGQTTISLDQVRESIQKSNNEKETLISGLHAVCRQLEAGQGVIYKKVEADGKQKIEMAGGYALSMGENTTIVYDMGEGLVGQSAANGKTLYVDDIPEGHVKIVSGLGMASPKYLLIVPIKLEQGVVGVMELATFTAINENQRMFAEESAQLIAARISGK